MRMLEKRPPLSRAGRKPSRRRRIFRAGLLCLFLAGVAFTMIRLTAGASLSAGGRIPPPSVSAARPTEAAQSAPRDAALDETLALVRRAVSIYGKARAYQAIFRTLETGENGVRREEISLLKFRKPFTIFMGWIAGDKRGLQILYAENRFDDKMFVRMPGFLFNLIPLLSVAIDDPRVRRMEKHSIKTAGIGYFLGEFEENLAVSARKGSLKILSVRPESVEGEAGTLVDVMLDDSCDYPHTAVVFSEKHGLPIEVRLSASPKEFTEMYRYLGLALDPADEDPEFKKTADPRIYSKYLSAS